MNRSSDAIGHNESLTPSKCGGAACVGGVDDNITIEPVVGTPKVSSVINDHIGGDLNDTTLVVVNHIAGGFSFRAIGGIDAADVNQALTIQITDPDIVVAVNCHCLLYTSDAADE